MTAGATTLVLPTDAQLIAKADVIVEGTVLRVSPVARGRAIWTEAAIAVAEVRKGVAPALVLVREPGGILGDRITKVFGAPVWTEGERVLVFLHATPGGGYRTVDLGAGKFTAVLSGDGRPAWERHLDGSEVTLLDGRLAPSGAHEFEREAAGFERYIADRLEGREGEAAYSMAAGGAPPAASEFELIDEPEVYRWFAFDDGASVKWYSYGTQSGYGNGGVSEVGAALAPWNGYTQAKIRYVYSGTTSVPGSMDSLNGRNEIRFGDPLGEISGAWDPSKGGVVGQGGFNGISSARNWTAPFAADGAHPLKTYAAWEIVEGFMTIQDNVSPSTGVSSGALAEIIAHEFGHTLGMGHSTDPAALMYPTLSGAGASLRSDDQLAARWLYPAGGSIPVTSAPAAPGGLLAYVSGTTVKLAWTDNSSNESGFTIYAASGSSPFAKRSTAGANATSATLGGFTAGPWSFYVTAYNAVGESASSNTATVTVAQALSAAFTVAPVIGTAGETVFAFSDTSSGSPSTRLWSFGDTATSQEASPTHVYAAAGMYQVTLTVSDATSKSSASRTVTVLDPGAPPPQLAAAFDFSPPGGAGEVVAFYDRSTGRPVSWSWSFGDGGTSAEQNPLHPFASEGTYEVTLTVSDGSASASVTREVEVGAAHAYRALVSAAAQTAGAGGSLWRTELTLFNAGTERADLELAFYDASGAGVRSATHSVGPMSGVSWASALEEIFGLESGAGAIAIEATSASGAPPLRVSSRTFDESGTGTRGQAVPAVEPSDLASTVWLTSLREDASFRTNVGLVNRSSAGVSVVLTLFSGGGVAAGSRTVVVPARSFTQSSLLSHFPAAAGVAAPMALRAEAAMADAVSVYASIIDNVSQDAVYVQASEPAPGSSILIPAVARTDGANGTVWRSDVTLTNTRETAAVATFWFLPSGTDNRNAQRITRTVDARATIVVTDVLSRFGVSAGSGALEITWSGATAPVVASRTYTTDAGGGTFGQSVDRAGGFAGEVYVTGLRSDTAFRTNAGFVNGGSEPMIVTATLIGSGQTLASAAVALQPKSHLQQSLGALFPGAVLPDGVLTLRATSSTGTGLFAYVSVIDNASGDPVCFAAR